MKNHLPYQSALVGMVLIIIISPLTFVSGSEIYENQGIIMGLDLKQKIMIINEREFTWDETTKIFDDKETPITIERFKANRWVYIVGIKDKNSSLMKIEKIYLLPKYIDKKERNRFPFFQKKIDSPMN